MVAIRWSLVQWSRYSPVRVWPDYGMIVDRVIYLGTLSRLIRPHGLASSRVWRAVVASQPGHTRAPLVIQISMTGPDRSSMSDRPSRKATPMHHTRVDSLGEVYGPRPHARPRRTHGCPATGGLGRQGHQDRTAGQRRYPGFHGSAQPGFPKSAPHWSARPRALANGCRPPYWRR